MFNRFKTWLKKSGIKYMYAYGKPMQGKEIIDSLNPLEEVIIDKDYPWARIYSTTFQEGLIDTFNVLIGRHYDLSMEGSGRKGILDLLIFPVIARRLMVHALESYDLGRSRFLVGVEFIAATLLEIPRFILGGVLTLGLSPIVAAVHLGSYFYSDNIRNNFFKDLGLSYSERQNILQGNYNSEFIHYQLVNNIQSEMAPSYSLQLRLAGTANDILQIEAKQENRQRIESLLQTNMAKATFAYRDNIAEKGDGLRNLLQSQALALKETKIKIFTNPHNPTFFSLAEMSVNNAPANNNQSVEINVNNAVECNDNRTLSPA